MRILMINHEFTITGSSTAFYRLALHLINQGHEIKIFACNPQDGPMKTRYDERGIPVIGTAVMADFDLAIANTICSASMVLKVAKHLRTIWFINEAEVGLNILLKNTELLPAFGLAAAVIYNMPFQHDVYRSFTYQLDQQKFYTASFGVDIDHASLAHDKIPAKSKTLRAVQVGTVEPRKRPGDFIQAVARSGLDMEAVICGKFFHIDDAAQNIIEREPDKYRIISDLPDAEVLAWVASADMFCLASSSETQSLSAYEAALLGRALLLSDLACYHGVFIHGRNALMFPPGRIDMLALSMNMYAANPALRQEMGQAAKRTAARYSNAAFFSRFDAIMSSVVAQAA
jgi:glycosyltransferase involved in cell wall biosynthesis